MSKADRRYVDADRVAGIEERLIAVPDAARLAARFQLLAGLVRNRKVGRTVYYRVADTHVRLLLDVAIEHYLHDHDEH